MKEETKNRLFIEGGNMKRYRTGTTVVVPPFLRVVVAVADTDAGVISSSREEGVGLVEDDPTVGGLSLKLLDQQRPKKQLQN